MDQRTTRTTTRTRTIVGFVTALTIGIVLALASGAGDARAQDTASVSIVDFAFEPGTITVEVGTTVTWTNNGAAPHTVTADDGSFDSGTIDSGGAYSQTFDTPGTYSYFCAIHPSMVASVVVTGGDDGGDDGDDTPPTTVPDTGVGPAAMHDSTSLLLGLAVVASALIAFAVRQRQVA
ncbi:MAG: cupredoxin domain-containing protein [Thermomicrobiales bacterium]